MAVSAHTQKRKWKK